MLRLLLLRHAEAVVRAPGGDSERRLTAQGRANARRVGIYLRTSSLLPNRAISSPALRARDTLDVILRELPQDPPSRDFYDALYYADSETLLDMLSQTPGSVKTLLVIGHNPGVGEFARFLLRPENALPKHFSAPCLAVIDLLCGDWSEAGASCGRLDLFKDFSSSQADDSVPRT
jgi:phosphohistidine phosphatase